MIMSIIVTVTIHVIEQEDGAAATVSTFLHLKLMLNGLVYVTFNVSFDKMNIT